MNPRLQQAVRPQSQATVWASHKSGFCPHRTHRLPLNKKHETLLSHSSVWQLSCLVLNQSIVKSLKARTHKTPSSLLLPPHIQSPLHYYLLPHQVAARVPLGLPRGGGPWDAVRARRRRKRRGARGGSTATCAQRVSGSGVRSNCCCWAPATLARAPQSNR